MPRRRWRQLPADALTEHFRVYPCADECPVRERIDQLFGVLTFDLLEERRATGARVPLTAQMVNARQMRAVIAQFVEHLGVAVRTGRIAERPILQTQMERGLGKFIGLALACLCDLCFNLEYLRRITDQRWSYCNAGGQHRAFYPFLGVCPYCIRGAARPAEAVIGAPADADADDLEDRRRYFGNKIQSHHVGRIGEKVVTLIMDLITKAHDPNATTGLVFDDQHDIDTVFFFDGLADVPPR